MKRLEQFDVFSVPTDRIYYDASFNCRQMFTPQSVKDLADSIGEDKLYFPVVVQPIADMASPPAGYDWRLICGHRRFMAVTLFLKWIEIPATVRYGLTERDAEILNLTENLERKDLNPLEEAIAVRRRFPEGASLREAAKELKRDTTWIRQRMRLLALPEEIQQKVAARLLTLLDVDALYKLPPDEQIAAATEIETARANKQGTKLNLDNRYRRKLKLRRSKKALNSMTAYLMERGIEGLCTRLLSWCAGETSDEEIIADIDEEIGNLNRKNCVVGVKADGCSA